MDHQAEALVTVPVSQAADTSQPHPDETLTVAQGVLERLEAEGVDAVFGIPGGNIAAFQQELRDHSSIRFIIAAHEGGAAFMADGYARATGKLGVCLVTSGPGVTNALTGIASAHLDEVPLLVISGQVATDRFGLSAIQESTAASGIETAAMLSHATSFSMSVVDAQSFPRLFTKALRTALNAPRGAVHLSIPSNVSRQSFPKAHLSANSLHMRSPSASSDDIRAAFALLQDAKRPLILLGSGARDAMVEMEKELRAFVHRHCIPVASSLRGKGLYSERDPFSLGVIGTAADPRAEAYLRYGVDVLLVLGSRLGEWTSRSFHPHFQAVEKVIQVDLDPRAMGQFLPVSLPIVGDAASVIQGLCKLGKAVPPRISFLREGDFANALPVISSITPDSEERLHPAVVMSELDTMLRPDMDIYVDMGNCTGWATHCLRIVPPARIFYPSGLSSMGWSCGAVVGGKAGRPDRVALALTGDGSFLMNGTELLTAARYKIGTVTLVLNDNYLGMVNHGERAQVGHYSLDDDFYALGNPDLVQFAESLGARAYKARQPGDVARLLAQAIEHARQDRQPQVIVAEIDHRIPPPYGERFKAVAGDGH